MYVGVRVRIVIITVMVVMIAIIVTIAIILIIGTIIVIIVTIIAIIVIVVIIVVTVAIILTIGMVVIVYPEAWRKLWAGQLRSLALLPRRTSTLRLKWGYQNHESCLERIVNF